MQPCGKSWKIIMSQKQKQEARLYDNQLIFIYHYIVRSSLMIYDTCKLPHLGAPNCQHLMDRYNNVSHYPSESRMMMAAPFQLRDLQQNKVGEMQLRTARISYKWPKSNIKTFGITFSIQCMLFACVLTGMAILDWDMCKGINDPAVSVIHS